jgi:hypothetical protein
VALAFVANVSEMGLIFLAFSSVIFPIMIVLGVVTLIRTLQIAIDFVRLTQAINRIRHYYIEVAPELEPYVSFPRFDDPDTVRHSMMPAHSRLQDLASTPGPILLINSVLTGAFAGIVANGIFAAEVGLAIIVAVVALVVAFIAHRLYVNRFWEQWARQDLEVRFPSPPN